jgi:hypothetical protein
LRKVVVEETGTQPCIHFYAASEGRNRAHVVSDAYLSNSGAGYPIQLDGCCFSSFSDIKVIASGAAYAVYINTDTSGAQQTYGNIFSQCYLSGGTSVTNFIYDGFNSYTTTNRVGFYSQGNFYSKWAFNEIECNFTDFKVRGNKMIWLDSAPVAGTWAQGDICWKTGVSAGGSPGWVCTTGGSPGTWKAMASVAS